MEALLSRNYEGGTIRLARPLAPGVSRVNITDPTFSDLAGVLTGAKPVTYTSCSHERLPLLQDLCARLKLKCIPAEKFAGRSCFHMEGSKEIFFIGRDEKLLTKAALTWKDPKNNERWSVMLGYPECCIRMYRQWLDTMGQGQDLVEMAYKGTAGKEKLDFRMNNGYNYSSRIHNDNAADQRSYAKVEKYNSGYVFQTLHVIGWHPCSYDCPGSLRKAADIFAFIKHYAPEYAAALEAALAKPVLFWGKYRYAFVDGRLKDGRIAGPAVSLPRSLLDDGLYRRLALSDEIRVSGGRAEPFRGGKPLFSTLAARPFVLNFEKLPARRKGPGERAAGHR